MSWWDYGYQISGMATRTVIVDNKMWNKTHIATVRKAMNSSEHVSYKIARKRDVNYVLVIFAGLIGYRSHDVKKFLCMVRIAACIRRTFWRGRLQKPDQTWQYLALESDWRRRNMKSYRDLHCKLCFCSKFNESLLLRWSDETSVHGVCARVPTLTHLSHTASCLCFLLYFSRCGSAREASHRRRPFRYPRSCFPSY